MTKMQAATHSILPTRAPALESASSARSLWWRVGEAAATRREPKRAARGSASTFGGDLAASVLEEETVRVPLPPSSWLRSLSMVSESSSHRTWGEG